MIPLNLEKNSRGCQEKHNKRLKKRVYYFFFCNTEREWTKSNESSSNKKSDVVEIDIASNHINNTHEVHEVSIIRKVQEGEHLKKGVSNVTNKRGLGTYRKYTD